MGEVMTVLEIAAVVSLPGLVFGALAGLRLPWAAAAAMPVSFGLYGLAAYVFGEAGIEYRPATVSLFLLAALSLAAGWRTAFRGWRRPRPWRRPRSLHGFLRGYPWLIPALGVGIGSIIALCLGIGFLADTTHSLGSVFRGWDVQWHTNMVRFGLDEGMLDPTRMGELRNYETHAFEYYPSAWHAGLAIAAALFDIPAVDVVNAGYFVTAGIGFSLALAALAWVMVDSRGLIAQLGSAIAGAMAFGAPVLIWVGHFVGAWPYTTATAFSGIVAALFFTVPGNPKAVLPVLVAFAGVVQIQAAPATTVVPVVALWWATRLLFQPARRVSGIGAGVVARLKDVGLLAAAGGGALILLLPQVLSGGELVGSVREEAPEDEDVSRAESWAIALGMRTRHVDQFFPDLTLWPVFVAAAAGAIYLIVWRRNAWPPLFYLISAALTTHSVLSFGGVLGEPLDALAGLHYGTPHRLVMPLGMITFAAAGVGIAAVVCGLAKLVTPRTATTLATTVSLVGGLGATVGVVAYLAGQARPGIEDEVRLPYDEPLAFREQERRAYEWLSHQPPAYDGVIYGAGQDGEGWAYALHGLPTFNRHYTLPDTSPGTDAGIVHNEAGLLGAGVDGDPGRANHVDDAARRLGINFFILAPPSFWDDPNIYGGMMGGLHEAPGTTMVYKDGGIEIFALNAAFGDRELTQMRTSGGSPDPLPPVPTRAEMGAFDADGNLPYYRRPLIG